MYPMILLILMIAMVLLYLNLIISKKELFNREKMSTFECGFNPLSSPRLPFSINFYLIGILFLIFDIEVIFIFPFIKLFKMLMFYEFMIIMMMILLILYMGLEFEKNEGSLKWLF